MRFYHLSNYFRIIHLRGSLGPISQRTFSSLVCLSETQRIKRGQHASFVLAARFVQETAFYESYAKGMST